MDRGIIQRDDYGYQCSARLSRLKDSGLLSEQLIDILNRDGIFPLDDNPGIMKEKSPIKRLLLYGLIPDFYK
jgi:hypothetical protein